MLTLATTPFPAAALRRAVGGAFGLADVPTGQGCCAGMGSFLVGGVARRAYPAGHGDTGAAAVVAGRGSLPAHDEGGGPLPAVRLGRVPGPGHQRPSAVG